MTNKTIHTTEKEADDWTLTRSEIEEVRHQYNAAVANGLIIKARQIGRVLTSLECNSRDDDRSAGRWCAECSQHGSHHTDKHAEFQRSWDGGGDA